MFSVPAGSSASTDPDRWRRREIRPVATSFYCFHWPKWIQNTWFGAKILHIYHWKWGAKSKTTVQQGVASMDHNRKSGLLLLCPTQESFVTLQYWRHWPCPPVWCTHPEWLMPLTLGHKDHPTGAMVAIFLRIMPGATGMTWYVRFNFWADAMILSWMPLSVNAGEVRWLFEGDGHGWFCNFRRPAFDFINSIIILSEFRSGFQAGDDLSRNDIIGPGWWKSCPQCLLPEYHRDWLLHHYSLDGFSRRQQPSWANS